ncbi:MAG: hypothetical protein ABIH59_01610 [archaeon]
MKNLIIIGGENSGKDIVHIVEEINKKNLEWNILGVVDERVELHNQEYLSTKYLGGIEWLETFKEELYIVSGLGKGNSRKRLLDLAVSFKPDIKFANIIHPNAIISKHAKIGKGNIISSLCQIQPSAVIGDFNFLNIGVQVGHDCQVGSYCSLNPNVGMYNSSKIGDFCYLAARSTIIQEAKLGDNIFVVAGTIVNKDVPDSHTAIGCPCKIIDKNFTKLL